MVLEPEEGTVVGRGRGQGRVSDRESPAEIILIPTFEFLAHLNVIQTSPAHLHHPLSIIFRTFVWSQKKAGMIRLSELSDWTPPSSTVEISPAVDELLGGTTLRGGVKDDIGRCAVKNLSGYKA